MINNHPTFDKKSFEIAAKKLEKVLQERATKLKTREEEIMPEEENIETELRAFLGFDSNLYATLTAISIQLGLATDEEFDKFVEDIDSDKSWEEYYKVFKSLYTQEEIATMIPIMKKLFDSEQEAFVAIENRIDSYLEEKASPNITH